jgi:hypothetical protein
MVMLNQKIRTQLLVGQLIRNTLYTVIKQNGCRIKFNLVVDLSALTNVAWNSKFAMFMGRTNTQKFDVSMSIITM